MVKVSASSPEAALGVAKAGIDYMHNNFEFVDPSMPSTVVKFSEYMKKKFTPFATGVIVGSKARDTKPQLAVPYKGEVLKGEALKKQLTKWAKYGTMEPDAAASISRLADGPLDLTGQHFVLIGAGSAMGPFIKLLEHGATVVAIDIPGAWGAGPSKMWERLVTTARNSSGTIIFPIAKDQQSYANDADMFAGCGCNLTEQPGEIAAWLKTVSPSSRLTIGNYTYLDGDLHVKLSLAADAVIADVCKARPDTAIAFLCTPTDIHFVPDEAHNAALKNYGFHLGKGVELLIHLLTMGTKLVKNALPPVTAADGSKVKMIDGLSVAQGPNYALAKRLQHWRAIVAYDNMHTVSSNIAPSTSTLSVVSNKTFAWAYAGMPYFKPYEIYVQDTTNALMAAVLISDITDKTSAVSTVFETLYFMVNAFFITIQVCVFFNSFIFYPQFIFLCFSIFLSQPCTVGQPCEPDRQGHQEPPGAVQVQLGARRAVARGLQGGLHRRGLSHDLLSGRPQGLPARHVRPVCAHRLPRRQVRPQSGVKRFHICVQAWTASLAESV